jgi:hypothetical protein
MPKMARADALLTIPSEHYEQVRFVGKFRISYPGVMIFAIPNGGKRDKITAMKLKNEGVLPGVPDLFIPAWRLFVEMKKVKGGALSKDQKEVIPELEAIGYTVIVGYGSDDALEKVSHVVTGEDDMK